MPRAAPLLLVLLLAACAEPAVPEDDAAAPRSPADQTLAEAIAAHGGDRYTRSTVRFTFRGDAFAIARAPDGAWSVTRTDSSGTLVDRLGPEGVTRTVAGRPVSLQPDEARSLETALNSVAYFALLPYKLQDPAVQARALPPDTVRGVPYDVVEVTFTPEGGGRDWEDRFVVWLRDDATRALDYLAYRFHTGEGGTRFRAAFNARTVGGIRLADYRNYTADRDSVLFEPLERYPELLEAGDLELVSDVILEDVTVE